MNDRGQTAYDYLLGIVLLLVTIVAVLALFPQFFSPFVDPVSADREEMADRVAAEVIEESATLDSERTLDDEAFNGTDVGELKARAGVDDFRRVYVELRAGPEQNPEIGVEPPPGEPTATTVRNVRTAQKECSEGCRLVVRVW